MGNHVVGTVQWRFAPNSAPQHVVDKCRKSHHRLDERAMRFSPLLLSMSFDPSLGRFAAVWQSGLLR
jgi:hypothetical protein